MINIPQYILKVLNILYENGYEGYLVGGCVRDALMGKEPHDFDLTTNAAPNEIISCFSDMKIIETGLKHGTVTVVSDGHNVEITTYRIDGKYVDNRHPEEVVFTRDIHQDLSRRDFTVNAIAYSPRDGIVDIFGGRDDIKDRIIRCVGDPDARFNEDGLRIMRAIRFSSVLGFDIDADTSASIHSNMHLLGNISAERIYSELKKLMCGSGVYDILKNYDDVIFSVFPALSSYEDQYNHNIKLISSLKQDIILRFCALFYNMNIEDIESSLKLLKPDNFLLNNVIRLCGAVTENISCDDISVKYVMNKLDHDNIMRLIDLKSNFDVSFNNKVFLSAYNRLFDENVCVSIKQLDINGGDLIELGIKKGPEIGGILTKLLTEVIEERCENKKESLINYVHYNIFSS